MNGGAARLPGPSLTSEVNRRPSRCPKASLVLQLDASNLSKQTEQMPSAAKALRSAPHWAAYFYNKARRRARRSSGATYSSPILHISRVTATAKAQPRTSRAIVLMLESIISLRTIGGKGQPLQ